MTSFDFRGKEDSGFVVRSTRMLGAGMDGSKAGVEG
jgi:hypothetical protein